MADKIKTEAFVFTSAHPITFPNLDTPRAVEKNGKPTGEPKYSGSIEMALDAADLAAAKVVAAKVAKERWPGRQLSELAFPFTLGSKLADKAKASGKDREFSRDKVVLTARSKFQPILSIIEGRTVVDIEPGPQASALIKKSFYSGCQCVFEVSFAAYDGVGSNPDGVNAYLNKVLSLRKGERVLGGGHSGAETFKGYIGTMTQEDPTVGLDDEIPF